MPARPAAAWRTRHAWERIPFSAWLKISGPTFAVMALGFTALWNAQQATTQRIMELQESLQRILEMEQTTTDRILEMQRTTTDRILELQQQRLDLHAEERPKRS